MLACCTWLTVCRLFVRSTRGRTELSVGLRRTMAKQPTTINISGSVLPMHSHIVAEAASDAVRFAAMFAHRRHSAAETGQLGKNCRPFLSHRQIASRAARVAMARGERATVARGRGRGGGRGRGRESAASPTAPTEVRGPVGPLLLFFSCPATPAPLPVGRRRRHQRTASTRMRAGSSSRAATRRGSSGSTTQRSRTPSSTRARPRCGVTLPCCSPPLTTLAPSCPLLCTRSASALPARRCV